MAKIKVCIDPGHGGTERANRGPTGYIEPDGVLKISLYLRDELLATGAFDVLLTRDKDATLSLTQRGKMAASFGADLFISEHTNASNGKVSGAVVFTSIARKDDAFGATMAAEIARELGIPTLGNRKRPSTTRPGRDYYTVMDTAIVGGVKHMLLIESAFHDHPGDEALLKQDAVLRRIAKVQARVICDFFGVSKASNPQPVATMDKKFEVTASSLNIRAAAGTSTPIVGAYQQGDIIVGLESKDGWVRTNKGWVSTQYLKEVVPAAQDPVVILRPGDKGDAVRQLQRDINKLGIHLVVDGDYGTKTTDAVKDFQRTRKLAIDGVAGPATLTAIKNELEALAKKAIADEQKKIAEEQLNKDRQAIASAAPGLPRDLVDAVLKLIRR